MRRARLATTRRSRPRVCGVKAGAKRRSRARSNSAEAKSRPPRPRAEPEVTSLRVWRELIGAVLASRATPSLGLVLHGMDHPNDFEDFPVSGRERIARKRLSETVLASMRDDTLYDFVR